MDINPISMKRIYQSVIEQFVNLIKNGKLSYGDKLPSERVLADMFGVSRPSIREAFSAMEIIGLIDVRPGEGAFLTELNIAPFINTIAPLLLNKNGMEYDLLEFRKMLELEAIDLAVDKTGTEEFEVLLKPLEMMKGSVEKMDPGLGAEADIAFHKELLLLSGNYVLLKAAECVSFILEDSVRFNREVILKDPKNAQILLEQHIEIYEALCRKDRLKAGFLMKKHLDFVKRSISP
jgi:GntR family transcriptional regulator, transcriptional repressor for pyruvate dehydrogenase complex